jgi:chromosome segregation ATPase
MSLKKFRNDATDLPGEDPDNSTPSSFYRKDRNTLKIDRLSTRVTIITVLLPVFMGVVLFFIYLDIRDQLTGVDTAKNTQVDQLTLQMEHKLNALDVRIAKNRFDLDEKLPPLEEKTGALEQRLGKMAATKADVKALEEGITRLENQLSRQDQRIQNNADQNQANLAEMERINSTLISSLAQNREQLENQIQALKQETATLQPLKQELSSLRARMDESRVDLGPVQKTLSQLEKQVTELENQLMSRTEITRRLMALKTDMDQSLSNLEKKISTPPLPIPDSISEETLKQ